MGGRSTTASAGEEEEATAGVPPKDELRTLIEASGVRMFAFDFDMTVTSRHCYNASVTVEQIQTGGRIRTRGHAAPRGASADLENHRSMWLPMVHRNLR